MSHKPKKIADLIVLVILLVILYYAYQFYQTNNFNEFVRSETSLYTSTFERDQEEKYSEKSSYKIESPEYNDAMFYKTVQVEKNQPYKVTCMVKTKNVQSQDGNSGVGAQISIEGTTERSIAISGTNNEWQKIELIFNSKNREEVNIGFRLGGYLGKAKGEAWFSDFTLEEGISSADSEWKFVCFIFENIDVNINGNQVQLQMTPNDISDIKNTIGRFEDTAGELSQGKMNAQCDIYNVTTPLTKLSYDEQFAYYVSPEDVESQIKETINKNDYDHIFIIVRLRR